jgi:hypothetical protein
MGKGGNPLFSADRPRRIQMNIIAALKTVAVVAVSLLLISCAATVPVMTDEYDAQAEAFEPKQGEANIYVMTRENVDRIRLEARAGSNYFIEVEPKMGWLAAG